MPMKNDLKMHLVAAATVALGLTGCGGQAEPEQIVQEPPAEDVVPADTFEQEEAAEDAVEAPPPHGATQAVEARAEDGVDTAAAAAEPQPEPQAETEPDVSSDDDALQPSSRARRRPRRQVAPRSPRSAAPGPAGPVGSGSVTCGASCGADCGGEPGDEE